MQTTGKSNVKTEGSAQFLSARESGIKISDTSPANQEDFNVSATPPPLSTTDHISNFK